MKIYLAGASHQAERDTIRRCRDKLIAAGHTITRDWVSIVDAYVAAGKTDRDLTAKERREYAEADLCGVRDADVFWLLIPANPKSSIGCWVELGHALANGYQNYVIVSGDAGTTIFCEPVREICASHDIALESLLTHWASTATPKTASALLCPCQGPEDDPGPHIDGCPWQDENYAPGGVAF